MKTLPKISWLRSFPSKGKRQKRITQTPLFSHFRESLEAIRGNKVQSYKKQSFDEN